MQYMEITDIAGNHWRVELKRPRILIGRDPSCDISLPHIKVSRRHAQLQRNSKGQWIIQDIHSKNFVFINGQRVEQAILEIGMDVKIADYHLVLLEASTILEPGRVGAYDSVGWTDLSTDWLDHLHSIQYALMHMEYPRQVLERSAEEFCRICKPEAVAVGCVGTDRYRWEVVIGPGATPEASYLDEALQQIPGESSEIRMWGPDGATSSSPETSQSLLFPMKGRSGVIGHIYVHHPKQSPMTPDLQRYLTILATETGLAYDNLSLASLRRKTNEIEQSFAEARKIQTGLFPANFDVPPGLEAFAVNLPSVYVSGDYYDLFCYGPSRVAFIIADAMGHGMPAALMMTLVQAWLHAGKMLSQSWETIFNGLDTVICQGGHGAYVTGILGHVDLEKKEMQIVCAGHPSPSILVGGQPVELPESCRTRPWGLDYPYPWEMGCIPLGNADWSMVLYTDGLTDGESRAKKLNTKRVLNYHRTHAQLSAEDLCQGLLSEAACRQPDGSLIDDQTVLVLRSEKKGRRNPKTLHDS